MHLCGKFDDNIKSWKNGEVEDCINFALFCLIALGHMFEKGHKIHANLITFMALCDCYIFSFLHATLLEFRFSFSLCPRRVLNPNSNTTGAPLRPSAIWVSISGLKKQPCKQFSSGTSPYSPRRRACSLCLALSRTLSPASQLLA